MSPQVCPETSSIKEEEEDVYSTSVDSSMDDSVNSSGSTSSSVDWIEDDVSSPGLGDHSHGPLYDLSELISQLPVKRGLSKFYQGKSQSYTSLASVKSLEDLAKKGSCLEKSRMKSCKSYAGAFSPKATISKKGTKTAVTCLGRRGGSLVGAIGFCGK